MSRAGGQVPPAPGDFPEDALPRTRAAIVVHPVLKTAPEDSRRPLEAQLEEAVGLALAINLKIVHAETLRLAHARPDTLIGSGLVERIGAIVREQEAELVIVNCGLAPVQQRNLERAWDCKVVDRTGIILEIFGARARTHEGRLQVELAAMAYARSRLVRSWTHLERQRGGLGFVGGPGESQIEIDRRLISARIARLERELEDVKRTRGLHRSARRRVPWPVVALAGYTNAGKSTLFNHLTDAGVLAHDMLFATLDPTMRMVDFGGGRKFILSDTVGFISSLPTALVAAFRATLEEVTEADFILHVRNAADPEAEAQAADVRKVLEGLGVAAETPVLEVYNKIDLLPEEEREALLRRTARADNAVAVSALTGAGIDLLRHAVVSLLERQHHRLEVAVPHADGRHIAWLYAHGQVLSRDDDGDMALMTVALPPAAAGRYRQLFPAGEDSPKDEKKGD